MANAKLTLASKQPEQATLEFNGKEYNVLYTHIDYLKAMNVYGQMEKVKNTNQNNVFENCELAVGTYDEALRIVREMIGNLALTEILTIAEAELDVDSVTQILAACVSAITNRINAEQKEKIDAEIAKLDNV